MESYTTVLDIGRCEYEDRKSVFIGEAIPVSSEAEALDFIASVKKKYSDARHHVYAYVLRDNSIMRFSDDKEPQGTAGMPVLDAIRKRGCVDVCIVVTRYFGGTLLGTGGLVRAYTAAAVGALENASVVTYDTYAEYNITVSYSDYQKLSAKLSDYHFRVKEVKYSDNVIILGTVLKTQAEKFEKNVRELLSDRAKNEFLGFKFDF